MFKIMLKILPIFILFISGCISPSGTRIDNIPMYGQPEIQRPYFLKKADQNFIKEVTQAYGNREEASRVWWQQGEKYMEEGNFDYAMRRYNQSWLLNPNNYQPYWGFARVLIEKGEIDKAINFLEKSQSLIDNKFQEVALLSDIGSAYSFKATTLPEINEKEKSKYFEIANRYFSDSTELDPTYPESWRRWAYSLYEQGNYPETWIKIKKARELGATPYPESFLKAINSKMPEPK